MKPRLTDDMITLEVLFRIVLVAPPVGVDFGIQHGKGSKYTTILTQRSQGTDLIVEFALVVKKKAGYELPDFSGPLSQGSAGGRFVYIDIGTYAGQSDSRWQRRIKVPLSGITWEMIQKVKGNRKHILEARLPGTGKDGGPSCATVHSLDGWKVRKR